MNSDKSLHPDVQFSLEVYRNTVSSFDERLQLDTPGSERMLLRDAIAQSIKDPNQRKIFLSECEKISN